MDIERNYRKIRPKLIKIAKSLECDICDALQSLNKEVDFVKFRVKSLSSFLNKSQLKKCGNEKNDENSICEKKYKNPFTQIQDQIGFKIIVKHKSSVKKTIKELAEWDDSIIESDPKSKDVTEFGYESQHLICRIPKKKLESGVSLRDFEIQISTLFQHAWAEATHDILYKGTKHLTREQKRSLAFVAAQAWGADKILEDLFKELNSEKWFKTRDIS